MNPPNTESPADAKLSEADYLKQQSDAAKVAISTALADAKHALAEGVDPKEWTRRFPMVAIGSAVAAGFVTAVLAIPSKEQQELKKIEKLRKALEPEVKPKSESANGHHVEPEKTSVPMWATILKEALQLIRPILVSMLTAGFAAKEEMDPQPTETPPVDPITPQP